MISTATLAAELQATVIAGLPATATPDSSGFTPGGFDKVNVLPLAAGSDHSDLWAVFSQDFRNLDRRQNHFVVIYTLDDTGWREVSRLELENADYLTPTSVRPVPVEPGHIWLEVQSEAGAHSGCYDLLSFNAQTLTNTISHCSDSYGAGEVRDLNGDAIQEVILNLTDSYVFCYICGVRLVQFQVLRWDGRQWREINLAILPASAPAELRNLNNRAIELAQANLWPQAQATISQVLALQAQDETLTWNAALIRLQAEGRAEDIQDSSYPLLSILFYGDYTAVLDMMRPYPVEQLFSRTGPLVERVFADELEETLSQWIIKTTTPAIQVEPELAAAYFLRGWATHLVSPDHPEALADIERAAELDPAEPLFSQSVAYLKE